MTTRIAQILLEKDSPETVENINHILQIMELSSPSQTVYEGKHPFVECSAYADWIKYRGGSWQSNWHFVDVPILDQGGGIRNFTVPEHNSTETVQAIVNWFNNTPGYQESPIYKSIMENGPYGHSHFDSFSIGLRLLIHIVGDMH